MRGLGQERFHQVRQQPETLDDDARLGREAKQILDDQVEALASKPVERLEHGFGRSVDPALVQVHLHECAEERGGLRSAAARVLRHHVVGRVEPEALLRGDATGDRRLARGAAAADPAHGALS